MAYTQRLTRPQQRAVLTADTRGLVSGHGVTLQSLVQRGIATAGPYRLTDSGHRLREQLACPVADFPVNYGNNEALVASSERQQAVAEACSTLLHHRVLYGPVGVPAEWERLQPLRAAAILLEAGGAQPSATDDYGRRNRAGYSLSVVNAARTVRLQHHVPHQWTEVGHEERREEDALYSAHTAAYEQYEEILENVGWFTHVEFRGYTNRMFMLTAPAR